MAPAFSLRRLPAELSRTLIIITCVTERLEQSGLSVWVDVSGLQAGVDFLSKIGEAIIDAKVSDR